MLGLIDVALAGKATGWMSCSCDLLLACSRIRRVPRSRFGFPLAFHAFESLTWATREMRGIKPDASGFLRTTTFLVAGVERELLLVEAWGL